MKSTVASRWHFAVRSFILLTMRPAVNLRLRRHGPRASAAIAVASLALAACGGGGEDDDQEAREETSASSRADAGPRPVETAEEAVGRLAQAARDGHCSSPGELFHQDEMPRRVCQEVLQRVELSDEPRDLETYGPGAILRDGDGGEIVLVLDTDRRYKWAFKGYPADVPQREAERVLPYVIGALRRGDCSLLRRVSVVYTNLPGGRDVCARGDIPQTRKALDRNPRADVAPLGGDRGVAFYGLDAGRAGYFTLVLAAHDEGAYSLESSYMTRAPR